MATQKERELMREIMDLALDIGAGKYDVSFDYHGHIHAFDVRIAKRGSSDWVFYSDTVYLSGRTEVFTEKRSLGELSHILLEVKKHHPAYDSDGVKL